MKHRLVAALFVIASIVVLVGLNRKRVPEAPPRVEEKVKASGWISSAATTSIPVEPIDTNIAATADQNTNARQAQLRDATLARPRRDLGPRLISVITNQLARLGPLEEETYDIEDWHKLNLAKMDYLAGWGTALLRFAQNNGGNFPETLDQAAQFYPEEDAWLLSVFDKSRFEIMYQGSLNDLRDPANVILVRERVPTVVLRLAQHWQKAYVSGDAHVTIVAGFHSIDEFQAYESQHLANSDGP